MYAAEDEAQKLELRGNALLAHRRSKIRPIVDEFERWCEAIEPTLLPSELLRAAVRYYRNHGKALFRFIDDPLVPIDNRQRSESFRTSPSPDSTCSSLAALREHTEPRSCSASSRLVARSESQPRLTSHGHSSASGLIAECTGSNSTR
ncbi:MAG: transposase, partial [Myxococcales bacterium]|nr:transposase [Myxococcales bacterium]